MEMQVNESQRFSVMRPSSPFLIAEAGVNHNGDFMQAMKLADAAKWAGADAVKYQLFDSKKLWGDDRIKELELSREQIKDLSVYCKVIGIEFMCTPFDVEAVDYLASLKVQRLKIASGCLMNHDILYAAYQTGLPVILSTGMSTMDEIEEALGTLAANVTLLHCTSSYPCRLEDVHLNAMDSLRVFGRPVGLSDHTSGITVAIAATAKGATVIEKHLTLDRKQPGPDHQSSVTPTELKALHIAMIEVTTALGETEKKVRACEEPLRKAWRVH